jgi:hypothetical protein
MMHQNFLLRFDKGTEMTTSLPSGCGGIAKALIKQSRPMHPELKARANYLNS